MTTTQDGQFSPFTKRDAIKSVLLAIFFVYLFLIGIECMGKGLKGLNLGKELFNYFGPDANPFLGLFVGILATTLMQSSSATTALIVAMVGAETISVSAAIPMVMGANIGTTVTNTIAALAHMARPSEFKRAFTAATCHDFFNFMAVLILLPLELIARSVWGTGALERVAYELATVTEGMPGTKEKGLVKRSIKWGYEQVTGALESIGLEGKTMKIVLIVVGLVIMFAALAGVIRAMRQLVVSRMEKYVNKFVGSGGLLAMAVGMVLTVFVQSSSITTSILVPLAGAGILTARQIYPVTLGANIGTTVTGLLAAFAVSGAGAFLARQVAFVHLLFNIGGIILLFMPAWWRWTPVNMAERMADFAVERRRWAVFYVFGIFYIVPGLIFLITHLFG